MRSLVKSLDTFVSKCDWLTTNDQPALDSLYLMAELIDADPQGNNKLFGNFGIAYRALLKRAPVNKTAPDELEELLTL